MDDGGRKQGTTRGSACGVRGLLSPPFISNATILAMSSRSLLPVELIYSIISSLRSAPAAECSWGLYDGGEPQTALAACSLVSRTWRDIAQPMLFENPIVMLQNVCGMLAEVLLPT